MSSAPIYQQMLEYLELLISQNQSTPNYRLPSENQLAKKFGSSRIPAKQALRHLEEAGVIYRQKGRGTYICNDIVQKEGQKHYNFCLLLPRVENFFYCDILNGVRQALDERGDELYTVISDDDINREEQALKAIVKRNFDGILIYPVVNHTYNNALLEVTIKHLPVIMMGRSLPGLKLSCVYSDHYEQAYEATRYLIEKGHRKIAMLTESSEIAPPCEERIRGYKTCVMEYLGARNIMLEEVDFFASDYVREDITQAMERIFEKNPSALIITNKEYNCTVDCIKKQHFTGDILFFDGPAAEISMDNKLIIMNQNPRKIGYQAAKLLYERLEQDAPIQNVEIDFCFVEK